ncbi:hypothetical protein IG631_21875 [Alternaria alternata]|nr:hypothetical protein IG631_21875 [Alternaria alternata]
MAIEANEKAIAQWRNCTTTDDCRRSLKLQASVQRAAEVPLVKSFLHANPRPIPCISRRLFIATPASLPFLGNLHPTRLPISRDITGPRRPAHRVLGTTLRSDSQPVATTSHAVVVGPSSTEVHDTARLLLPPRTYR